MQDIYDEQNKKLFDYYVGANHNGYISEEFIIYNDKVLLLLDNALFVFNGDGTYEKIISYPRIEPDGLYTAAAWGDGTYYLDQEKGIIYMVQGYQVIAIDVESGEIRLLFRQDYLYYPGTLLHDEGKLYLAGWPGGEKDRILSYGHHNIKQTQILVYDLETKNMTRYVTEGAYFTHEIRHGELVLREAAVLDSRWGEYVRTVDEKSYPLDILVSR